jgi:predicted TIM-barrel enzyme
MKLSDHWRTPEPIFTRDAILARLRKTIADQKPVVAAGSSCGLVAKSAEVGGADLIVVYSTGLSRLLGLPTTIFGDTNNATLAMAEQILNVVIDTPVICGVEAADPRWMRLAKLVDRVKDAGYSGVINFPTVTLFEAGSLQRREKDGTGFGFNRELDLMGLARERDLFTMCYVFTPEEAEQMAKAGVDCVVAHVGGTSGGFDGFHNVAPVDVALTKTDEMIDAARKVNPEVIVLGHGGPFDTPENVQVLYERSKAQGFVGASSVERIPIEAAVSEAVRSFKSATVPAKNA